jgi:ribosome-binding protein aMBF1 (putative translation factor)
MSDLRAYIHTRKETDPEFAQEFESGYEKFQLGVMLRFAREDAGLTQEQVAEKLGTKKTAISRIENHAEDIKYARAFGKTLQLRLVDSIEGSL